MLECGDTPIPIIQFITLLSHTINAIKHLPQNRRGICSLQFPQLPQLSLKVFTVEVSSLKQYVDQLTHKILTEHCDAASELATAKSSILCHKSTFILKEFAVSHSVEESIASNSLTLQVPANALELQISSSINHQLDGALSQHKTNLLQRDRPLTLNEEADGAEL